MTPQKDPEERTPRKKVKPVPLSKATDTQLQNSNVPILVEIKDLKIKGAGKAAGPRRENIRRLYNGRMSDVSAGEIPSHNPGKIEGILTDHNVKLAAPPLVTKVLGQGAKDRRNSLGRMAGHLRYEAGRAGKTVEMTASAADLLDNAALAKGTAPVPEKARKVAAEEAPATHAEKPLKDRIAALTGDDPKAFNLLSSNATEKDGGTGAERDEAALRVIAAVKTQGDSELLAQPELVKGLARSCAQLPEGISEIPRFLRVLRKNSKTLSGQNLTGLIAAYKKMREKKAEPPPQ